MMDEVTLADASVTFGDEGKRFFARVLVFGLD